MPVRFEPGSEGPQALEAEARVLARGCLPAFPAASADGRWISAVLPDGPSLRIERLATGGDAALAMRAP